MTLAGWTLPQTPTGRASTVPPPPWHYSGDIIAVDFTRRSGARRGARARRLLTARRRQLHVLLLRLVLRRGPRSARQGRSGQGPVQGSLRHPERNLRWPAVRTRAVHLGRFRAVALARADPGLPEEARRDPHDARRRDREGRRAESGRRALRSARLESRAAAGDRARSRCEETVTGALPAGALPQVHTRLWPSLEHDQPAVHELSLVTVTDVEIGTVWRGDAALELGASEFEELDLLAPRSVGPGWVYSMAFSVIGGTSMPLRGAR